jgi:hypothetical protein
MNQISWEYQLGAFDLTYRKGKWRLSEPAAPQMSYEIARIVAMHESELAAFLKWQAAVDRLVYQSWARLEAQWPSVWSDTRPEPSPYEEEIRHAYESRDREGLKRALKTEEQWLLNWHETHPEVGGLAIARRILQEYSKPAAPRGLEGGVS